MRVPDKYTCFSLLKSTVLSCFKKLFIYLHPIFNNSTCSAGTCWFGAESNRQLLKSESNERQTHTQLVSFFLWDIMMTRKNIRCQLHPLTQLAMHKWKVRATDESASQRSSQLVTLTVIYSVCLPVTQWWFDCKAASRPINQLGSQALTKLMT